MQRQILCKSSSKLDVHNVIIGGVGGRREPLEGLKRKAQFTHFNIVHSRCNYVIFINNQYELVALYYLFVG